MNNHLTSGDARSFIVFSTVNEDVNIPFKAFTDVHPLMMAMPIAILCDQVSDQTVDVLGKYITQILGRDAPVVDYMLEFMSSGLDPPDDTSVLQKEAPKKPSSTPQQKQTEKKSPGSGGPDPEKDPDPNEDPEKDRIKNEDDEVKDFFEKKQKSGELIKYRSKGDKQAYKDTSNGDIYYKDGTHTDIEVFSKLGKHKGSINPKTFEFYKAPNPRYRLPRWLM